jgi:Fe-S cluster assembly protein SufD
MKLSGFGLDTTLTPPPQTEAWRFSNVTAQLPTELRPASKTSSNADVVLSGATITVNQLPAGVSLVESSATVSEQFWSALPSYGGKIHLRVTRSPERPLRIRIARDSQVLEEATLGRIAIDVAPAMRLEIEQEVTGSATGLTTAETTLHLEADAQIDHVISLLDGPEALQVTSFHAELAARAHLTQTFVAVGGKMTRLQVSASMNGEGAHASLASIAALTGRSQLDLNSKLTHNAPRTTAKQLAKNLLDGESKAIFTGKVYIARDAQQVAAEQMNRNLLLSRKAHAIGQPQLEIFADDVKCSHGSTTGQVEEDATFYLLSRGIPADRARSLLTKAFIAEVIHNAPESLRGFLGGRV